MRYLFVFASFEFSARETVKKSGATDVEVIPVPNKHKVPPPVVVAKVARCRAACSGIAKPYRRQLRAILNLEYEGKEYRPDDQQLRNWLVPAVPITQTTPKPSDAFQAEAKKTPRLILMPGCLDTADELTPLRWPFVQAAAILLGRLARGEDCGNPRDWKHKHGARYSRNGDVRYTFEFTHHGKKYSEKEVDFHLKEGDYTERENCARVYYWRCGADPANRLILVFYVGPHPKPNVYESKHQIP
jgi:hypothetical protein